MNQKGFVNILVIIGVVMFVGISGYFIVYQQKPSYVVTQLPIQNHESTLTPTPSPSPKLTQVKAFVSSTATAKVETAGWNTLTDTQYGFEFKYPATWKATVNASEGSDHKVIARVVNPSHPGKPDTDLPIEQLLIRSQNVTCEGQFINLGGKTGTGNGWEQGFGLIYYRDLCFKTQGWSITILLSAVDQSSQAVMDTILSTFKFTK